MNKKRLVIKMGSNLLIREKYVLNEQFIKSISIQIAKLFHDRNEIILVTSGAIGTGLSRLDLKKGFKSMREKQAAAAVGQPILMQAYEENFNKQNISVAQLLLTREDFNDRNRYLNLRNTILCLLQMGCIPIVNENDTVAVEEIQFGDNDTLSALVASKIEADMLIILTDVEGLYTDDPNRNSNAKLITEVKEINTEIEQIAQKSVGSYFSTGGMSTKVQAAKVATASGVEVVITDGNIEDILIKIVKGDEIGTKFISQSEVIDARKRWIAFGTKIKGKICIDDGAVEALVSRNKSLLPSGIVSIEGNFDVGDTVSVVSKSGKEMARGIVYYTSGEIDKIKGKKTDQIQKIINKCDFEEIIHKDNLVIIS